MNMDRLISALSQHASESPSEESDAMSVSSHMHRNKGNWYYRLNKERLGPVTKSEIFDMYRQGTIKSKTRVWNGNSVATWTKIKDVPEFASLQTPNAPRGNGECEMAQFSPEVTELLVEYIDQVKDFVRNEDSEFWQDAMQELRKYYDELEHQRPRFSNPKSFQYGTVMKGKTQSYLYTMQEVIDIKNKSRKDHLGTARENFVTASMANWEEATNQAVAACSQVLLTHIRAKIASLFPQRDTPLHNMMMEMANFLHNEATKEATEHATIILKRELESEFTLSSFHLQAAYEFALDQLLKGYGLETGNNTKIDERKEAVSIMAHASAYYDMSFRRLVDMLALAIDDIMFRGFSRRLDTAMRHRMNQCDWKTGTTITERQRRVSIDSTANKKLQWNKSLSHGGGVQSPKDLLLNVGSTW
jgi:hypothetical protein